MEHAVRVDQILERNVADAVDLPAIQHAEMKTWTPDEARRFLVAAQSSRHYSVLVQALTTGMRAGELFGLR